MEPRQTTDADPFVLVQRHLDARRWLEARALLTPLAEDDDARAQAVLSRLDERGLGAPRDLAASFRWCAGAAARGHREAMRWLGLKHRFGHGTPVDLDKAAAWFWKGMDQGDLDALCELADLQRTRGDGMRDAAEAARLYLRGAAAGAVMAQWALGKMLTKGEGGELDRVEAWLWFQRALEHSQHPIAWERDRVTALEKLMTDEELQAAKRRLENEGNKLEPVLSPHR